MRVYYQAAISLLMALSANIQANAGDANPPIDNGSANIDFSTATILASDKSGYSGMIVVDDAHKIYLTCTDSLAGTIPCAIHSGLLDMSYYSFADKSFKSAFLTFVPEATSVSTTFSGATGAGSCPDTTIISVLAGGNVVKNFTPVPSVFNFPWIYTSPLGTSFLGVRADFSETCGGIPGDPSYFWQLSIRGVTWTAKAPSATYKLFVRTLNGGGDGVAGSATQIDRADPTKISDGSTITLPLGSRAMITLKDASTGVDINATYSFIAAPQFNPSISADDQSKGLYMDRLGVLLNGGQSVTDLDSVWVHMGTQTLVITPTDSSKPSITVNVRVNTPKSLGSSTFTDPLTGKTANNNQTYDDLIVQYAHLRGIPPQFIKGTIRQESIFVPSSYRYEPQSSDLSNFINKGALESKEYQPYVFGPISNPNISENLKNVRSIYGVYLNRKYINVPANYEVVARKPLSAQELLIVNNDGLGGFARQNWVDVTTNAELDGDGLIYKYIKSNQSYSQKNYANYNFTAQTALASSYGLMHILYSTGVQEGKFIANSFGRDPYQLLTPSTNIDVGSAVMVSKFLNIKGISVIDYPSLVQKWRYCFKRYNGEGLPITSNSSYNYKVWSYSIVYFPSGSSSIFSGQ